MPESHALRPLEEACASTVDTWFGALLGRPETEGRAADADVRAMSDDGLVRTVDALAALARRVDALQARCAAELADRSHGDVGADVARKHGFASAERLIMQSSGGRFSDAARLVRVGRATAGRPSFLGEILPPKHPQLAAALDAGVVGICSAELIRSFLDGIALRAEPDELEAAEELLVDRAPVVCADGLPRLIKHLEAHLDPDGVRPREDELRERRSLRIWEDRFGMIRLQGAFDPVDGAPIKVAVDALVSAELRATRGSGGEGRRADAGKNSADDGRYGCEPNGGGGCGNGCEPGASCGHDTDVDPLLAEDRSIPQLNADALADLARHALGCSDAPTVLRGVTVVARVDAEALVSGTGHATIDGIDMPISILSARELALGVGVVPLLVGTGCTPLDLGRTARLFTRAQKIALVERDGGCAWPGCGRPAAYSEAHHIQWWHRDDGPTSVENGIMLCSHHHHRVHADGWEVFIEDGRSWFIPPSHLDLERVPRAGNVAPGHLVARHLSGRRRTRPGPSTRATVSR